MKSLLILRHAKSSWKVLDLADHDRPLNERGKRDAPRMGHLLRDENLVPSLVLSSTAKRARKTAAKVAQACGYEGHIQLDDRLYHADCQAWLEVLREVPEENDRVLGVGHNPDLEELLELLTGCSEAMPTAALAHVALPIASWQQLPDEPEGKLVHLWRPRDLA